MSIKNQKSLVLRNSKGFIALFSVIIISFTLLLMTVTLNFSNLFGRFNILDSEFKEQSGEFAYACIETARFVLAGKILDGDTSFSGTNPDVSVGNGTCVYEISNGEIIKTWAEVPETNGASTYYAVRIDTDDSGLPVDCFQELLTEDDDLDLSTC